MSSTSHDKKASFYIYRVGIFFPLLLSLCSCGLFNSCSHRQVKTGAGSPQASSASPSLRAKLKQRLMATSPGEGPSLAQHKRVTAFYQARDYAPVWTDGEHWSEQLEPFLNQLSETWREGLNPTYYHLPELQKLRESKDQVDRAAALDVLLTDAYFSYGSDLAIGRVNPNAIEEDSDLRRREPRLGLRLTEALRTNNVVASLKSLAPDSKAYAALEAGMEAYRKIASAGGWPMIPPGPTLIKGAKGERVALLRKRLEVTGELKSVEPAVFDDDVFNALTTFQRNHNLPADGVLSTPTLSALNVPVQSRIDQIAVNLERWRWLPREVGGRHIIVDVAKYEVTAYNGKTPELSMKAIIGTDEKATPTLLDEMTYIVLNPAWNIPPSIVKEELLPKIRRDPNYLKRHSIGVFRVVDGRRDPVSPSSVNWSAIQGSEESFPYQLTQSPGPKNPLGSIKFVFPNPYAIYLHGTTAPGLFNLKERAFSHGCIRIQKPLELALYVLNQNREGKEVWTREKLLAAIHEGEQRTLKLPEPIPVEVLYWTVMADDKGQLQFREDVYGWDSPVSVALRQGRPPSRHAE